MNLPQQQSRATNGEESSNYVLFLTVVICRIVYRSEPLEANSEFGARDLQSNCNSRSESCALNNRCETFSNHCESNVALP